ncbi:hypothetical protein PFICI_08676 [Pestalotiopsis fici W106-1]|uniref:Tat pathway signal sequence n=1 Tax=Pestalotiopsis fici (strain W106-1 / CGMCC3.15140) TaxID=1229662 RepID=W3WY75_PESFW|nr:uncharacterized protein PFICI_08676 [Pestalotiopsis fici W106-1]ETS78823.1 hypothetical protein PFICI_08676 [Pestalotiopsis fici W106-1]
MPSVRDAENDSLGEEEAFLPDSKGSYEKQLIRSQRKGRFRPPQSWSAFLFVQIFLIAVYTTTFFTSTEKDLVYCDIRHTAPARSAIQHQAVRFNATLVIDSPYNGPPSQEVDKAWGDLLENMNIAVPKSDIERIGATSIPIPDTDNMYFAGLGVFHELHCIKRLRQYTWKEHYFPNSTAEEDRLNRLHTGKQNMDIVDVLADAYKSPDHCLEIMRQATLCRADISLFTLQWSTDSPWPRADFSHEHQCVDFDLINSWAGQRRVDASKPGILTHPKFGVAYHEGESSIIGATEDMSPTIIT